MSKSGIPDLPDSPNQPASSSFLKKLFGKICPASSVEHRWGSSESTLDGGWIGLEL